MDMDTLNKKTVTFCLPFLIDNIYDVNGMLDHLYQSDTITLDQKEEISLKDTRRKKIETLIEVIKNRNRNSFDEFCNALLNLNLEFVVQHLRSKQQELFLETAPSEPDWIVSELKDSGDHRMSEQDMVFISRELPPCALFSVGVLMGFSKSKLEQYQASDSHLPSVQIFKMLCDWLAKEDSQATVIRFVNIMREAGVDETEYKHIILEHHCRNNSDRMKWV